MKKRISLLLALFLTLSPFVSAMTQYENYMSIKNNELSKNDREHIYEIMAKYEKDMEWKSEAEISRTNLDSIEILDNYISETSAQYNTPSSMPLVVKNNLLMITLFKYELMIYEWILKPTDTASNDVEYIIEWKKVSLWWDVKLFTYVDADINNDKKLDRVSIITIDKWGSWTFYYVVADLETNTWYEWTNWILIWDRVAFQTLNVDKWLIMANYAKRYPWESFTDRASVGATKYIRYNNNNWMLEELDFPKLSQSEAEKLAGGKWWTSKEWEKVSILDWEDQIWYVQKENLNTWDKIIMMVHNVNNEWKTWAEVYNNKDLVRYTIDWEQVSLWNSVKVFTFIEADINKDWLNDKVSVITVDNWWSGTFFYIVADIQTSTWYKWTNGILIWDRIAMNNLEYRDSTIMANYAKRYPWEAFSETPSIAATKRVKYEDSMLKELEFPKLSQKDAESLAHEKWWIPSKWDYQNEQINILDWEDQIWYVEMIVEWLKDDSVDATRKIMTVHYVLNEWKAWWEILTQYKCKKWRWQDYFSSELCK